MLSHIHFIYYMRNSPNRNNVEFAYFTDPDGDVGSGIWYIYDNSFGRTLRALKETELHQSHVKMVL